MLAVVARMETAGFGMRVAAAHMTGGLRNRWNC